MNEKSLSLIFFFFFSNVIVAILIGFILRFSVGFYLFKYKKRKNKADQIRDETKQFFLSYEEKHGFSIKSTSRISYKQQLF